MLVEAVATDTGDLTDSDEVSVDVYNNVAPMVAIDAPGVGEVVSGVVDVVASASDDDAVVEVEFFVDAVSIGVDDDGSDGWSVPWDTTVGVNRSGVVVEAVATDTGDLTDSDEVSVDVYNDEDPPVVPPAPSGRFVDDDGSIHEPDIELIAAAGITLGCNPPMNDRYCPDGVVSRGQMAAFLVRALDLPVDID